VAINRAYKVTHNGVVTQGEGGVMPVNGGVMQFTSPAVTVTIKAADYRRLAWAVDKYIYNIYVTTAETDGARGMCVGAPDHRRRALDKPAFPADTVVTKAQAAAACASLAEQSANCEFDIRMANDKAAIELIANDFKLVEETVKELDAAVKKSKPTKGAPTTQRLRVTSPAGALEAMSAVATCVLVAAAV